MHLADFCEEVLRKRIKIVFLLLIMIEIKISENITSICPELVVAAIECKVSNSAFNEYLWQKIEAFSNDFKATHQLSDINARPAIFATREAYKKLGKDPNRYRPSAEALCRRIVKGVELYRINTLVDVINLISLKTGYSIGGFDADKIVGNVLTLGVGKADEPFDAIGRGALNIENLPVYRDAIGGIGTPTSDVERTKISPETSRLLMIINAYSGEEGLEEALSYSMKLLEEFAFASRIESKKLVCC